MVLLLSACYDTAHAKARELSDALLLQAWPGETVFVDFFHPSALNYWLNFVSLFHSILPFDGLWIVSWIKIYLLYHLCLCFVLLLTSAFLFAVIIIVHLLVMGALLTRH